MTGKTVATLDAGLLSEQQSLVLGENHGTFATHQKALEFAVRHAGAEAIIRRQDGFHDVYSLAGEAVHLNRAETEQVADYPVAEITTDGSEVTQPVTLVTADDYELQSPQIHQNVYSGNHYKFFSNVRLSPISFVAPEEMQSILRKNSTVGIGAKNLSRDAVVLHLKPVLQILDTYDPHAADWIRGLNSEDIELVSSGKYVAAYRAIYADSQGFGVGNLFIDDSFWKFSDVEKASVLYHEYIHSAESVLSTSFSWWEACFAGRDLYLNDVEKRAYLKQKDMLDFYGVTDLPAYGDVLLYLKESEEGGN